VQPPNRPDGESRLWTQHGQEVKTTHEGKRAGGTRCRKGNAAPELGWARHHEMGGETFKDLGESRHAGQEGTLFFTFGETTTLWRKK